MHRNARRIQSQLVVVSLALLLAACAGTDLRDSCEVGGFRDYADFDAADLRYVIAVKGDVTLEPFFALDASGLNDAPMSLALRLEASDESLSRAGCPAGSRLQTYRVTNSNAAWRLFWLTASGVEGSFGFAERAAGGAPQKVPRMVGLLLFDTATGDAQYACGCLR